MGGDSIRRDDGTLTPASPPATLARMSRSPTAAVIGAGPSGIAAADALVECDVPFTLLECDVPFTVFDAFGRAGGNSVAPLAAAHGDGDQRVAA
jgi:NADPH-dependent 2,4-dienoyl-CoA reductase/sulfur reductase-like enzyme